MMYQAEILISILLLSVAAVVIPAYLSWRSIEILMGRKAGKIK